MVERHLRLTIGGRVKGSESTLAIFPSFVRTKQGVAKS